MTCRRARGGTCTATRRRVIYVGKARSLKSASGRTFRARAPGRPQDRRLLDEIPRSRVIVTRTEVEALILENKSHQEGHGGPRFNIRLRDDKNFHVPQDERRPSASRGVVLGPAGRGSTATPTSDRTCRLDRAAVPSRWWRGNSRSRPATSRTWTARAAPLSPVPAQPVSGPVRLAGDDQEYGQAVNDARLFLEGRTRTS